MKNMLLFALIFAFLGCGAERHHMTLNDENGFDTKWNSKDKTLKILGWDKPYALFFFTSSCGACTEQVAVLDEFLGEFGDNFKIIGILGDGQNLSEDMKILKQKRVEFATTSDKRSVNYLSGLVGGVMGTPMTVMFDANGKKITNFLGLYPKSAFEKQLKLYL